MTTKRIVLDISEDLLNKIKQYAIEDRRTMKTILKIFVEDFIEGAIIEKQKLNKLNKPEYKLTKDVAITNENVYSDSNYKIEDFVELEQLGAKLRIEHDAKPPHIRDFDSKFYARHISDHERGWLYRNPSRTAEDYAKIWTKDLF